MNNPEEGCGSFWLSVRPHEAYADGVALLLQSYRGGIYTETYYNGKWYGWEKLVTNKPPQRMAIPLGAKFAITGNAEHYFWKDQENQIHINLTCRSMTPVDNGATIAILPEGYRPINQTTSPIELQKNGISGYKAAHVDTNPDGRMVIWGVNPADWGDGLIDIITLPHICYVAK